MSYTTIIGLLAVIALKALRNHTIHFHTTSIQGRETIHGQQTARHRFDSDKDSRNECCCTYNANPTFSRGSN